MKKYNLILTAMLAIALCFTACSSDDATTPSPVGARTEAVNGVTFEMIAVEGGTFTMGATQQQRDVHNCYGHVCGAPNLPDTCNFCHSSCNHYDKDLPTHNVTLSNFAIGRHEVTQGLWKAVMGSYPSIEPNATLGLGDNYPMYYVSWDDAQAFISKLNELTGETYRLPTEAEWEYAARGGNTSQGYKYSGSDNVDDVAAIRGRTHPVGTKQPNELGIYDMSGNVQEWCSDWYGAYTASAVTNPTGPLNGTYRTYRGGDWAGSAWHVRVSYRGYWVPIATDSYNNIGFRLARNSN